MHLSSFSSTAQIFCFLCQEHAAALLELPHLTPSATTRRAPTATSFKSSLFPVVLDVAPSLVLPISLVHDLQAAGAPSPRLCAHRPDGLVASDAAGHDTALWLPARGLTGPPFCVVLNLFPLQERQEFCITCGGS